MSLYVYGAGGQGRVVAEAARRSGRYRLVGFLDDDPRKHGTRLRDLQILGGIEALAGTGDPKAVALGVGANRARLDLAERLSREGVTLATIVHPSAELSTSASVGLGSYVGPFALLHADAAVGIACIVNSGAIVEHDARVGNVAHIAPGAVLGGAVTVGEGALVGMGARVLPGLTVGAWSIVGAGAVVVRDVAPDAVVAGVPARPRQAHRSGPGLQGEL